jgi:hypothetical protein
MTRDERKQYILSARKNLDDAMKKFKDVGISPILASFNVLLELSEILLSECERLETERGRLSKLLIEARVEIVDLRERIKELEEELKHSRISDEDLEKLLLDD